MQKKNFDITSPKLKRHLRKTGILASTVGKGQMPIPYLVKLKIDNEAKKTPQQSTGLRRM